MATVSATRRKRNRPLGIRETRCAGLSVLLASISVLHRHPLEVDGWIVTFRNPLRGFVRDASGRFPIGRVLDHNLDERQCLSALFLVSGFMGEAPPSIKCLFCL
jgi:hypothetical protein